MTKDIRCYHFFLAMADFRQQIYDRIKASSRESVILEEMKRLGFWKESTVPSLPEQIIRKEAALTQELTQLLEQQKKYKDKQEALKEIRKKRLEQSKLKREESKRIRKQKREQKAARWREQKEKDITYLGEDVSKGLNNKESDFTKLSQTSLPQIKSVEELANAMGVSVGSLRFLSYNRVISKTSHYKRFYIPKKTGGKRLISTPMPRLKAVQYWILENILNKVGISDAAHGFATNHSIVSNAAPHVKAEVLINIDLKDFFPSITYPRVKGVFKSFGYSEQISTILALMCTEAENDLIEIDGDTYYAAGTERFLPQGAPTSPAITNILCRGLDARLKGVSKKFGFNYTRYADDLTFSASGEAANSVKAFLGFVKRIIRDEKLTIHPEKFRVLRKGARKEVTGIVVNEKPSINGRTLDKFRALLFQIEKDGIANKHWNNSPNLLASIKGYANFINMVDPVKGAPIVERVSKILAAHQFRHRIVHKSKAMKEKEAQQQVKKKPWWKFW
jgi:RNA-directed DNA polymerase